MNARDVGRRLLVGLASMTLLARMRRWREPDADALRAEVTLRRGTARCPAWTFDFTTDADGTKHLRDDWVANRCNVDDRRPPRQRQSAPPPRTWISGRGWASTMSSSSGAPRASRTPVEPGRPGLHGRQLPRSAAGTSS